MKLRLLLLLLMLALAALAGCAVAPPPDTGAPEPVAEADEGVAGEYVPTPRNETVIVNEIGGNWDVWESYNLLAPNAAAPGIWQAAQEHLFNINWATGEFVYWLAESYDYNDDFTQLTIKTRPEAHWNDGTPFTAHDVKFTIEMVQSEIALRMGSTMQEWVSSVEASDDHTAVINLTKSNPRFHMNFARAWGFPVQAKHVWEGNDPLEFKNYPPVFTGPYKLHQEFPDQAMNIWVKDENYWGMDGMGVEVGPTYYVTRLERVPETEIADVKVNKIDHPHALGDATLMQAAVDANPAIQLAGWRDPCPRAIWFNNAKYPLSLPEVRHAINAAVNRQKVADLLFGVPTVPARFPGPTGACTTSTPSRTSGPSSSLTTTSIGAMRFSTNWASCPATMAFALTAKATRWSSKSMFRALPIPSTTSPSTCPRNWPRWVSRPMSSGSRVRPCGTPWTTAIST